MGGCQTASDNVQAPQKLGFPTQNRFKKLEKHKFEIPKRLDLQIVLSNEKITNYVTKTKTPIQLKYKNLDIGSNLGKDNKFTDSEFKANSEKLIQEQRKQKIEWKRPSSFMSYKHSVFEGKIQPTDIKQGKLGDCYLLSAISAISQYPFIIKRIFQATQTTIYGAYGIWLFIDGFWECVIVDDQFPTKNNKPVYSKNNGNQLWVMLLEKAYAKVFGSYFAIQSGLTGIGMNALTGAPYQYLCKDSSNKTDFNSAWQFISKHIEKNHMLTGSTQSHDRNKHMGILSTHSYTIMDARQVEIQGKGKMKRKQKILKLSNPWGKYEWKGRWSQYSDVWTSQLREELKHVKADDGIFWMGLQDFIENFGQICVCKYNKNYLSTSLPLTFDTEKQNDFKGIFLSVENKIQGHLNLIQQDHRFHLKTDYEYSLVRIIVLQIDKSTGHLHQYINDMMDCDHDASMALQLDQGQYYIIVEVDWKCNYTRDMVLNFYGQQSVSLIQDRNELKIEQLFNEIVFLHENHTEQERIYEYQKDSNIRRTTGCIAGYVYYHYSNHSKNNNGLCQAVTLKDNFNIQVHNQVKKDDFVVKLAPGQERIVRLKVQKQGNSHYSFSTKIQFYIIERYSLQKLRELTDRKPTKLKRREIDNQEIDVIVKTYNYTGGVAVLYQNKMDKYTYIEDITFEIENLELQNQQMTRTKNKKLQIQLQPQSQKLLSFIVSRPGKEIVFKTKISFYLNSPEFKF